MPYPELKLKLITLNRLLRQIQEQIAAKQISLAITDLDQAQNCIAEFCMLTESLHFYSLFHELDILSQFDSTIIILNTMPIDDELLNSRLNYLMACCRFLDFFLYAHVLHYVFIEESKTTPDESTKTYLMPLTCRASFFKKSTALMESRPNFHFTFNLDEIITQLGLITPEDKQRLCLSAFAEPNHEPAPAELMTIFAQSIGDDLWAGANIARLLQTIKDYRQVAEEESPNLDEHELSSLSLMY